MFQEYHNEAPDGLLRTTGVVAGLVSKIKAKFPTFEFPKKIEQFALSRTCFRMRAISRKLAADRAETLKAKRKVLDFIYSTEPSKKGKKVSKVLFLQICLFENSAESHFGQNDNLTRDTLAGTLWPETLWPERQFGQSDTLASFSCFLWGTKG